MNAPKRWQECEHRWRQTALEAMIPSGNTLPSAAALDLSDFWQMFEHHAPALLRIGFRLSVWAVTGLTWLRVRNTAPQYVEDTLVAMNSSGFLSRQLVTALKVVATLAYFSSDSVRRSIL